MNIVIPMLGMERNGGNRILFAIINQLAENGHDCEILTPDYNLPGFAVHHRVDVTRTRLVPHNKWLRWTIFTLTSALRLRNRNVLANHFLTAVSARLASLLSRSQVIYLIQDIEYHFYAPPLRYIAKLLCSFTYRLPCIVPANPYLEHALHEHGVKTHPSLELGIDRIFLDQPATVISKDVDIICFVRRGHHKRMDRLQAILRKISGHGYRVLAVTPDKALRKQFAHLFDEIILPTTDADIIKALDRSRIMLMCSEHEGFALPPLEAMARGLPVVMFPCGGPHVYARHGQNSLIVRDNNPESAAGLVTKLLNDNDLHAALSENARKTAGEYRLDNATTVFVQRLPEYFSQI